MTDRSVSFPDSAAGRVRLLAGGVLLALLLAPLVARSDPRISAPGRWRPHRPRPAEAELTEEQQAAIETLDSIGYLTGSREAGPEEGVTVHDEEATCPGLNLYTAGNAAEATLMDADGTVLHQWRYDYRDLPEDERRTDEERIQATEYWRRVHLLENGDLLAIYEGEGLLKIDRDSRMIWYRPNGAHHDLDVRPDGSIVVLTREAGVVPWINPESPVLEDFVSVLDADGNEKRSFSLADAFRDSDYEDYWTRTGRTSGDIFHTNSVEVLEGKLADRVDAFQRGCILTSMLYLDTIAVVNPDGPEVVWALRGTFRRQHDPTVLDNGHLLLFDNGGPRGYSEVLEIDPASEEVAWSYRGTADDAFQTDFCGASQRLPNGNTLITESDNGRAFEVTRDGEIVWEFVCPYRAGGNAEYIATLFELTRLPEDFPVDWIEGG